MNFQKLEKNNFVMYAMKMYNNPQCNDIEEFYEDLNRIKYIKRLLGKYESKGDLRERLLLNHLIILNNVFGSEACCRILFFKTEDKFHSHLKTLLSYLQYLPKSIPEVDLIEIPEHHKLSLILERIK